MSRPRHRTNNLDALRSIGIELCFTNQNAIGKEKTIETAAEPPSEPLEDTPYCPRCKTEFSLLPGSVLFDSVIRIEREESTGGCRWNVLNPDTECTECSFGWRTSGWCIFVDAMELEDESDNISMQNARRADLKSYYESIARGEKIMRYLKPIK